MIGPAICVNIENLRGVFIFYCRRHWYKILSSGEYQKQSKVKILGRYLYTETAAQLMRFCNCFSSTCAWLRLKFTWVYACNLSRLRCIFFPFFLFFYFYSFFLFFSLLFVSPCICSSYFYFVHHWQNTHVLFQVNFFAVWPRQTVVHNLNNY